MPITEFLDNNVELKPLIELIETIMNLPDENINDEVINSISEMFNNAVTTQIREQAITSLTVDFSNNNYDKATAIQIINNVKSSFNDYIDSLQPSGQKRKLLNRFFGILYEIFDHAIERYHKYNIILNMTLEDGAHVPTYAHETDAAADLYAKEDVTLRAHSLSNLIPTGVHIQLPNNWMAMIVPRSSIGMKTSLRLSNSVGIIDEQYLGSLGVLYDNISDSDYTIHAGDRIAQLLIFPSYHFKAQVVDNLQPTERGEGGFGSSGT